MFVKDLQLPEGAELLTDPDTVVLSVVEPKAFEEPVVEAAEEETAEVEVVAKGKASKEGEEEEEDAGKAKK